MEHLSICPKDGTTREILVNYLTTSLEMDIAYRTLKKLIESLEGNVHPEAILHSDQGVHNTHPEFQKRVKKLGFNQSMSRKGNDYMEYYNSSRYQWGLRRMTPEQFRGHLLAA
ncbi:DDE-type integrase/transposase/recombinase [Pseudalkalibacillus sp. SCS-8]|uniref:DDE-type integrase/transposase/recombinase n=1 Tax=Pseudalkalibacillus nanhaiensis TaxID=3115291 RepID=UPI0039C96C03